MTVTLAAGPYEAAFLPEVGMLGTSLSHGGEELLSLHGGVEAYRAGRTTGLPLLHPWANRLSQLSYRAAGVDVDLDGVAGIRIGDDGLPRHGTMAAQPGWEVVEAAPDALRARFDYGARPDLLVAFPYPHVVELDVSLGVDGLRVELALRPTGDRDVPVAFGWHPYLRPPGAREDWVLALPERTQLELDGRGIPTGATTPRAAESAPLGDRAFDDLFALGDDRTFSLGRIRVSFDAGFPFAQVYAPPDRPFVAIEPMTAATDALVRDECPLVAPGARFAAVFTVSAT